MDADKTERKLGLYFAGINIASIIIAGVTGFLTDIKGGLIAFIASIIVLTIIIQGYAQRKLENDEKDMETD